MYHREFFSEGQMRVTVYLRRSAVRRPTRVTYAAVRVRAHGEQLFRKIGYAPD